MHPIAHFKTITAHRHLVCRYCLRLGLVWQGLTHVINQYLDNITLQDIVDQQAGRAADDYVI